MICPPCRHDLHEFCRDCDCDCQTSEHGWPYEPSDDVPDDAWQQGQDRYEAAMYRDELT